MRAFAYERPENLAEATRLLATAGPDAMVLAGGTDLLVGLRDDTLQPRLVVDLKRVREFEGPTIARTDGRYTFGAMAVMGEIESHEGVIAELPALAEAAHWVGSVQIRNRATLAGNVCTCSPAADTIPPLLVYGATVVMLGPDGERRSTLDDFILGAKRTDLRRGELVTAIEVPVPPAGFGAAYTRLVRRRGTDLASVTLCAAVDRDGHATLAYGSVGPRTFLARDDSGTLADPAADAGARAAILERMLEQASPSERSLRASPDYRLAMLRVLSTRALDTAVQRARRGA